MKKLIAAFAAGMMISAAAASTAMAAGWKNSSIGWTFQHEDGSYAADGWELINNVYYYFDENGYMLSNTVTSDGYTVDANGAWVTSIPQNSGQPLALDGAARYVEKYLMDYYGLDAYEDGEYDVYTRNAHVTADKYIFDEIRWRMSDKAAEKLIARGGFPTANQLAWFTVEYDRHSGAVTIIE